MSTKFDFSPDTRELLAAAKEEEEEKKKAAEAEKIIQAIDYLVDLEKILRNPPKSEVKDESIKSKMLDLANRIKNELWLLVGLMASDVENMRILATFTDQAQGFYNDFPVQIRIGLYKNLRDANLMKIFFEDKEEYNR